MKFAILGLLLSLGTSAHADTLKCFFIEQGGNALTGTENRVIDTEKEHWVEIQGKARGCLVRASGDSLDLFVGDIQEYNGKRRVVANLAKATSAMPISRLVQAEALVKGDPTCTCWNDSTPQK